MLSIVKNYLVRIKLAMPKRYVTFVPAWKWGKITVLTLWSGLLLVTKTLKP